MKTIIFSLTLIGLGSLLYFLKRRSENKKINKIPIKENQILEIEISGPDPATLTFFVKNNKKLFKVPRHKKMSRENRKKMKAKAEASHKKILYLPEKNLKYFRDAISHFHIKHPYEKIVQKIIS